MCGWPAGWELARSSSTNSNARSPSTRGSGAHRSCQAGVVGPSGTGSVRADVGTGMATMTASAAAVATQRRTPMAHLGAQRSDQSAPRMPLSTAKRSHFSAPWQEKCDRLQEGLLEGQVHVVRVVRRRVPVAAVVRAPAVAGHPDLAEPDHVQDAEAVGVVDEVVREVVAVRLVTAAGDAAEAVLLGGEIAGSALGVLTERGL